jgi:NAD(P)-dependent dehydrogenase (short-subunit alcohol dehydrogenase family)
MSDVPNGVALITGSAQGLGWAIALRLATDGFDIALNDLPAKHDKLTEVAKEIEGLGRKTCIVPADVSEEDQVKQMVNSTVEQLGGLDVVCPCMIWVYHILIVAPQMIANAGVVYVKPFLSSMLKSTAHYLVS